MAFHRSFSLSDAVHKQSRLLACAFRKLIQRLWSKQASFCSCCCDFPSWFDNRFPHISISGYQCNDQRNLSSVLNLFYVFTQKAVQLFEMLLLQKWYNSRRHKNGFKSDIATQFMLTSDSSIITSSQKAIYQRWIARTKKEQMQSLYSRTKYLTKSI